ncbi:MAG: hypothetical protein ACP6IQ_01520 [Candidatus Njordarchaeia archaeon]
MFFGIQLLPGILFIVSFILSLVITKLYIDVAKKKRILSPDVHKIGNPLVVNRGGVAFIILPILTLIVPFMLSSWPNRSLLNESLSIIIATLLGGFVGYFDDNYDLGLFKVILTFLTAVPIIVLQAYYPRPLVPIIGRIRITIVYPLLVLIAMPVVSNAINMIDVMNGVMATSISTTLIAMLFWALFISDIPAACYISIALGITLGFLIFNKYPAKTFPGNIGSYAAGALLGATVIISRQEYIALIALLPVILNGFLLLSSIRGIMSRNVLQAKKGKAVLVQDGVLYANKKANAPLDLTRLILLFGPLPEKDVIRIYTLLFIESMILSILTGFLIYF